MVGERIMWAMVLYAAGFVSAVIVGAKNGEQMTAGVADVLAENRAGPEQYARKHPRSGPKLVAWMEKNWGSR